MIDYSPLFETMKKKDISSYNLTQKLGFSQTKYYRLKKNLPVTTDTLKELCILLECELHEVVRFVPSKEDGQ